MLLGVAPPREVDLVGEERVLAVGLDADLGSQQPVHGHGVRRRRSRQRGIGARERVAVGERVGDGDRRVVQAEHLALVAQELTGERPDRDPALGADDQLEREADEIGQPREDAVAFVRGHRRATGEERGVVPGGELLGLGQDLLERRPARRRRASARGARRRAPSWAACRSTRGRRSRSGSAS